MLIGYSPAKLNLLLKILGKRADNYHNLVTLYQLLSWGDTIKLHPSSSETRLSVTGPYAHQVPQGDNLEDNLLWRAWSLMAKDLSILGEKFNVELHKNIPVGSGLGGGSSNAATLMRMLRLLWAPDMPLDKLATLGASLGADIPLFIHGWSAQAHGTGEKLLPRYLTRYYYLVFCPHVHSSTAELFAILAQDREAQSKQGQDIAADYAELEAEIATNISHDNNAWLKLADGNDFLSYVIAKYPKLNQLRDLLHSLTLGKLGDQIFLSGTGSSMFAVYADKDQAIEAQQSILNSCGEQAFLLDGLPSTVPFASTDVSKLRAKDEESDKHNDSGCIQFAIFLSEGVFCNAAS